MKKVALSIFKRIFGYTIVKIVQEEKKLAFGINPFYDVEKKFSGIDLKTFVDVGANVGQAATKIRRHFPMADIHCIEPFKNTFDKLKENTKELKLKHYNFALGAKNENIEIKVDSLNRTSDTNSLISENSSLDSKNIVAEVIEVKKLDDFCTTSNINKIDYLKIDTEGYDLEVLKGATKYLENKLISFVETEVGMNPSNNFHVKFEEVKTFLESHNYYMFGLYEQVHEWQTGVPVLRRCNALFVSYDLAKKYAEKVN